MSVLEEEDEESASESSASAESPAGTLYTEKTST